MEPGRGHELGVSAHHGAYNVFTIDGLRVDRRRNLTIAALDAETDLFGVRVSGEAARVMVDVPEGLRGIYASQQRGFYLEGVRDVWRRVVPALPFSAISLNTRVEYVDFDTAIEGTSIAQLAVGLNFRPTEESVLKLDYIRGRGRDTFNNAAENAFVLFSLATYF